MPSRGRRLESVAHAMHGADGIGTELMAQRLDVAVDGAGAGCVDPVPDLFEQLFAGEHRLRAAGQRGQQIDRVIPILKYRMESDVLLIVMPVDSGQCLTDYMVDTAKPLSYSAIRSIIGECANVLREVIADTPSGIVITTDTVRVTTSGVQIADAPCATMLADTSATDRSAYGRS